MNTEKIKLALNNTKMWFRKNSPDILTYGGVAGTIGAGFLAAKATIKLEDTIDEIKEELESIQKKYDISDDSQKKEYYKELVKSYAKAAWKLAKLYGPAILLESASAASILSAHGLMKKSLSASAATIAAIEAAFSEYRERAKELYGEEADMDLMTGSHQEDIKIEDPETGKKVKQKVKVMAKPNNSNPYIYEFTYETSSMWEISEEYNKDLLRNARNNCQMLLDSRGYLFLEEVLNEIGIRPQFRDPILEHECGWVSYKEGDPRQIGDRVVDFGIARGYLEGTDYNEAFRKNIVPDAVLVFNCVGNITEHIPPFGDR